MLKKVVRPTNPYDPLWVAYWAENPELHRGVGADGVNEGEGEGEGEGQEDDKDKGTGEGEGGAGEGADKDKDNKPTDAEAALLKEVMDKKQKLKSLSSELDGLKATLKQYEGIDLKKVQDLMDQQKQAELKKLEDKGEWDKLRSQMVEQHEAALNAERSRVAELESLLSGKDNTINELTIGHSFDASDFIKDDLTLTPRKARIVYGDHFAVEDGKVVAYDKPSGSRDRTILVDAQGNPLSFNEAIKKIVDNDPDRDHIVKSKAKPGSDSKQKDKAKEAPVQLKGQSRIEAALSAGK